MKGKTMNRKFLLAVPFTLLVSPALAHVGAYHADDFCGGALHPLTGPDHVAAMVAVGLLAASNGGRALWLWPLAFASVMLAGGSVGMSHVAVPLVEPAIVASLLTLGVLIALAIDLPVSLGAIIVGAFALFHGYAHVAEIPDGSTGVAYLAGFALMTTLLQLIGIGVGMFLQLVQWQSAVRIAGMACVLLGIGLALNMI